ncbi:MAG: hypothetical protein R3B91_02025 [Planctomycetaceae bacterium]
MPERFATSVGERGGELSEVSGSASRLARAILRDPALLILDEATSAIDAQSETLIHSALKDFVVGRTVLMVTHMLSNSLLGIVTRIVVMDDGQVIATGSHEKLLATCPQYQKLYEAPLTSSGKAFSQEHLSHDPDPRLILGGLVPD